MTANFSSWRRTARSSCDSSSVVRSRLLSTGETTRSDSRLPIGVSLRTLIRRASRSDSEPDCWFAVIRCRPSSVMTIATGRRQCGAVTSPASTVVCTTTWIPINISQHLQFIVSPTANDRHCDDNERRCHGVEDSVDSLRAVFNAVSSMRFSQ